MHTVSKFYIYFGNFNEFKNVLWITSLQIKVKVFTPNKYQGHMSGIYTLHWHYNTITEYDSVGMRSLLLGDGSNNCVDDGLLLLLYIVWCGPSGVMWTKVG